MESNNKLERRILEVAQQQFVKKGYDKTNMSEIATIVGINRTTLHYYYRTKDKMFQAVCGNLVASFLPKLHLILKEEVSFLDRLEKILDEYMEIFMRNPFLPNFILGEIQRDVNHLLDVMRELGFDHYLKVFEECTLEEMEKGTIRRIPIPFIFLTFYSQMTFPFLTKELLVELFYKDSKEFSPFIQQWKEKIMEEMKLLLVP